MEAATPGKGKFAVATPGRNRLRLTSLYTGDARTPRPPAEPGIHRDVGITPRIPAEPTAPVGVTPRKHAPYIKTPKTHDFVNLPELDISRLQLGAGNHDDATVDEEQLRHRASTARDDAEAMKQVREWAALSRVRAQTERNKHSGGAWRATLPAALAPGAQSLAVVQASGKRQHSTAYPMSSMPRKRVITSVAASKTTLLDEYKHALEIRKACSCLSFWGSLMPQQQQDIVANARIEHYAPEVRLYALCGVCAMAVGRLRSARQCRRESSMPEHLGVDSSSSFSGSARCVLAMRTS